MNNKPVLLEAYIEGIGLLGPGLESWQASQSILSGQQVYVPQKTVIPAPELLPAAERRRASDIIKLTLATSQEAITAAKQHTADLPSVFSFSNGDGINCHIICETLASSDRQLSPTRFHNSVHNATAGYWSIAMAATATSSVLCAFDASFGAGLLEALSQVVIDDTRCILMASDTSYPEPMHSVRPILDNFGIALMLAPQRSPQSIAHISLSLTQDESDRLADKELEKLRLAVPAARGLSLLQVIATQQTAKRESAGSAEASGVTRLVLDYLDDTRLALEIRPC
ncbi:MAG: beta-ketoacyl synthase chain length factor [Nitrosomonadales bacterium]|nr:beta-ketoacyl synthase chain length factor [Nitrosomonadales bacterium]